MTNETIKSFIGEIRMFAGTSENIPKGWLLCNGACYNMEDYKALGYLLGGKYGGDGMFSFCVPDLRGRAPLNQGQGKGLKNYRIGLKGGHEKVNLSSKQIKHRHTLYGSKAVGEYNNPQGLSLAPLSGELDAEKKTHFFYKKPVDGQMVALYDKTVESAGEEKPEAHSNLMPYKVVHFIIATEGVYPREKEVADVSSAGYIGEIRLFPYVGIQPEGWMVCDGAILMISEYSALHNVIGSWGEMTLNTFCLPDLRGRIPLGTGESSASKTIYSLKDGGGDDSIKLSPDNIPSHSHNLMCSKQKATNYELTSKVVPAKLSYGTSEAKEEMAGYYKSNFEPAWALQEGSLSSDGGGHSHENRQPYLALLFCICVDGVYPPRADGEDAD